MDNASSVGEPSFILSDGRSLFLAGRSVMPDLRPQNVGVHFQLPVGKATRFCAHFAGPACRPMGINVEWDNSSKVTMMLMKGGVMP